MESFDLLSTLAGILIKISISYILLGLFTLIAVEAISSSLHLRSKFLYNSMKKNFNDEKMILFIYSHPLIKIIGENSSYIDRRIFSYVLIDFLKVRDINEFINSAANQQSPYYKNNFVQALCVLSRSATTVEELRKNASFLFNDFVHKVSNGYKRKIQGIILIVATILVLALNIDSVKLFNAISKNTLTKNVLETLSKNKSLPDSSINILSNLTPNAYPIGWSKDTQINSVTALIPTLLGWFITIFFTSFAAQFLYSRYINVKRSEVKGLLQNDE